MSWIEENGTAVVVCDGDGCTQRVSHPIERTDHMAATHLATRRCWYVSQRDGGRDYCAACRPHITLLDNIAEEALP